MPFTISLQITDIVRLRVNNTESFNLQCKASNDIKQRNSSDSNRRSSQMLASKLHFAW